jgi:hypothetical protein
VVPKDAIVEENARRYVMVAQRATEANTAPAEAPDEVGTAPVSRDTGWVAARVEVDTGLEDSNYTEVVSGIDDQTMVITLGQQTVNEGDLLEVGNLEETLKTRGALSADDALDQVKKEKAAEEASRPDGAQAS